MSDSILLAIKALRAEHASLDRAVGILEDLDGGSTPLAKRRGRPLKAKTHSNANPETRPSVIDIKYEPLARQMVDARKKAPRGLLRAKVLQALRAANGRALRPVELRDRVRKLGYTGMTDKSLYTAIFGVAKTDSAIKKTPAGFALLPGK